MTSKDSIFLVELNDAEVLEHSEYYVLATDIGDVIDIVTVMLQKEADNDTGLKSVKRICSPDEIIRREKEL